MTNVSQNKGMMKQRKIRKRRRKRGEWVTQENGVSLRAGWIWISITLNPLWAVRLMTAHTHNQVTEPRSLPQFKRQSVPGCSIILNTPPPPQIQRKWLCSFPQSKLQRRAIPSAPPHLTQSSASKPNHICRAALTGNFWVFSSYQQNYVHFLFRCCSEKPVGKDAINILCWD